MFNQSPVPFTSALLITQYGGCGHITQLERILA